MGCLPARWPNVTVASNSSSAVVTSTLLLLLPDKLYVLIGHKLYTQALTYVQYVVSLKYLQM